jgi:hypothetical protein
LYKKHGDRKNYQNCYDRNKVKESFVFEQEKWNKDEVIDGKKNKKREQVHPHPLDIRPDDFLLILKNKYRCCKYDQPNDGNNNWFGKSYNASSKFHVSNVSINGRFLPI